MKIRSFKIRILSPGENSLDGMKERMKKYIAETRSKNKKNEFEVMFTFPDFAMATKIFTPERIRMIQIVRDKKPKSIYELAKMLNRAMPNVHKDVHELCSMRVLELKKVRKKGQKRESLQPCCHWDTFEIAI